MAYSAVMSKRQIIRTRRDHFFLAFTPLSGSVLEILILAPLLHFLSSDKSMNFLKQRLRSELLVQLRSVLK
jgi:hypothetical protein